MNKHRKQKLLNYNWPFENINETTKLYLTDVLNKFRNNYDLKLGYDIAKRIFFSN